MPQTKTNMMFELKNLRRKLVNIQIGGINSIHRALMSKKDSKHIVFAEGLGLKEIFKIHEVDNRKTFSNHILEV